MSLLRNTVAEASAYALALAGRSRDHLPVPWTASTVMDDCAAFCSHVLWGGKPGPILWVDNFKTAGDGSYRAGSDDLAPWDVLLFDWEFNGVGNHVEFMVADLGNGYVRTYGANGSDTRAAKFRLRPKRYIMGRFRPRWGVIAVAAPAVVPAPAPPKITPKKEHDMLFVTSQKSGTNYVIGETTVQAVSGSRARTYSAAIPGDGHLFAELSSARVAGLIDDARTRRDALGLRVSDIITDALAREDAPADEDGATR